MQENKEKRNNRDSREPKQTKDNKKIAFGVGEATSLSSYQNVANNIKALIQLFQKKSQLVKLEYSSTGFFK